MSRIDAVIEDIKKLFKKQPNTIYKVRIVDEVYSGMINIFFEYYKIGYATTSQQIARLEGTYREQISAIKQKIKHETGLTVTIK